MAQQWEYAVEHRRPEEAWLQEMGKLGWELVSVSVTGGGVGSYSHCVFKRPKETND